MQAGAHARRAYEQNQPPAGSPAQADAMQHTAGGGGELTAAPGRGQ